MPPRWMSQKSPAQSQPGGESAPGSSRSHPLLPLRRLPNDERARAAEDQAKLEIRKLDSLLLLHGAPETNLIEKAILTTYIKAKALGMLNDG